eukprot:10245255-Ditylum_brightwellii.AAC.1
MEIRVKKINTKGWVPQVAFACHAKYVHKSSITPQIIPGKAPGEYTTCMMNHMVVATFHHIGRGPIHTEQVFGMIFTVITEASMIAVQAL